MPQKIQTHNRHSIHLSQPTLYRRTSTLRFTGNQYIKEAAKEQHPKP